MFSLSDIECLVKVGPILAPGLSLLKTYLFINLIKFALKISVFELKNRANINIIWDFLLFFRGLHGLSPAIGCGLLLVDTQAATNMHEIELYLT